MIQVEVITPSICWKKAPSNRATGNHTVTYASLCRTIMYGFIASVGFNKNATGICERIFLSCDAHVYTRTRFFLVSFYEPKE